jgi:hypothetical protein
MAAVCPRELLDLWKSAIIAATLLSTFFKVTGSMFRGNLDAS